MSRTSSSGILSQRIPLEEMRYLSPMRIDEVMVFDIPHGPDDYYVCLGAKPHWNASTWLSETVVVSGWVGTLGISLK